MSSNLKKESNIGSQKQPKYYNSQRKYIEATPTANSVRSFMIGANDSASQVAAWLEKSELQ